MHQCIAWQNLTHGPHAGEGASKFQQVSRLVFRHLNSWQLQFGPSLLDLESMHVADGDCLRCLLYAALSSTTDLAVLPVSSDVCADEAQPVQ